MFTSHLKVRALSDRTLELRSRVQARANRFLVGGGGVFQNLGPLPFQGDGGGGVDNVFSENKSSQNLSQTTFFQKFSKFSANKSFIF
jgi:hypothetical protein